MIESDQKVNTRVVFSVPIWILFCSASPRMYGYELMDSLECWIPAKDKTLIPPSLLSLLAKDYILIAR